MTPVLVAAEEKCINDILCLLSVSMHSKCCVHSISCLLSTSRNVQSSGSKTIKYTVPKVCFKILATSSIEIE